VLKSYRKVLKPRDIQVQTLGILEKKEKTNSTTDSEQLTGVDFAVRILR
jgi:hypothetical protein